MKAPDPKTVACSRCKAAIGAACASVGADSYARGAPLRRCHPERYAAARAARARKRQRARRKDGQR